MKLETIKSVLSTILVLTIVAATICMVILVPGYPLIWLWTHDITLSEFLTWLMASIGSMYFFSIKSGWDPIQYIQNYFNNDDDEEN